MFLLILCRERDHPMFVFLYPLILGLTIQGVISLPVLSKDFLYNPLKVCFLPLWYGPFPDWSLLSYVFSPQSLLLIPTYLLTVLLNTLTPLYSDPSTVSSLVRSGT